MLPGAALAFVLSGGMRGVGDRRAAARHRQHLPDRLGQLHDQRVARRGVRPSPSGQAPPAVGGRPDQRPAGLSAVGRPRRRGPRAGRADLAPLPAVLGGPAGDGRDLQRQAAAHQGPAVSRRAERVDQQPAAPAAGLERGGQRRSAAVQHRARLLDGRRLSDGDQALRRVPLHRRSRPGRPLPALVPVLHRAEPAGVGVLLRAVLRLLPGRVPGQVPHRVPAVHALPGAAVRVVPDHRHAHASRRRSTRNGCTGRGRS